MQAPQHPFKIVERADAPKGTANIGVGHMTGRIHCRKHKKALTTPMKIFFNGEVYIACPKCFEEEEGKVVGKPTVSDYGRSFKPFGVHIGGRGTVLAMTCDIAACHFPPIGRCLECTRDICQGCTSMYEDSITKDPTKGILCKECLETHAAAAGGTRQCADAECDEEGTNWCKACESQICDKHMSRRIEMCCLACEPMDG